jgi:hypothetical protein
MHRSIYVSFHVGVKQHFQIVILAKPESQYFAMGTQPFQPSATGSSPCATTQTPASPNAKLFAASLPPPPPLP